MKNSKRGTKVNTYKVKDIVKILKKENPRNVTEMYDLESKYELCFMYLDSGSFREVYEIVDYPLVLKVPNEIDSDDDAKDGDGWTHAQNELRAVRVINQKKKYEEIRKHMPKILWYNSDGVILMRRYKSVKRETKRLREVVNTMEEILERPFDSTGFSNWGKDESGEFILLDLGIIGMTKKQQMECLWGWNEHGATWKKT